MKLIVRVIVFLFLILPFTVVKVNGIWLAFQKDGEVDVVDSIFAALMLALFFGYIWSFIESLRDRFYYTQD